jgi:hypothetical protein
VCVPRAQLRFELEARAVAKLRGARTLSAAVFGSLLRFDGHEVEVYDPATGAMLGLRVPQETFELALEASQLVVSVRGRALA